jgi:hypothetical protein
MRNAGRLALLIVVVLALGFLVLPSTVSLFAGQHDWYDIDTAGNQIPCQKCHADIYVELNGSPYHKGWGTSNTTADEGDCVACHQANTSITYANGTTNQPGTGAHAAATIACMYCHGDSTTGAPVAGGFGLSNLANDTGTYAAHFDFVSTANSSSTILLDENEACIACHTHVAVKINFTHYKALEFDVTWNTTSSAYETSNYAINTSTGTVYTIWGNANGDGGLLNNSTTTTTWGTGTWP